VKVIAEVSALHAKLPMYNAQTVLELLRFQGAERVVLTGVTPEDWASGAWRDSDNPVFFALEDTRFPVTAIGADWRAETAEQDKMLGFLGQFPLGRQRLNQLGLADRALRAALELPQDANGVYSLWLEAVRAYHEAAMAALEEGPGTAQRVKRIAGVVSRLAELPRDSVVIAPLDDVPALLEAGLELPNLTGFQPGEASRFRAVVDRAYRLEAEDDLDALVHQLLELDAPADTVLARIALEARFAASGAYLSVGDLESARDLLEAVSQGQFERPSYLPGFVLARLGQVRDLMLERPRAIAAYRAALALAYCPAEAKAAAEAGLQRPFQFAA
jgi:hypothetical protein